MSVSLELLQRLIFLLKVKEKEAKVVRLEAGILKAISVECSFLRI